MDIYKMGYSTIMMIALKYILATLLAALPFICTPTFKKEEKTADGMTVSKHSLACLLTTYQPQVWNLLLAIGFFFAGLYDRMRKSDNSWKSYTYILLIVLLVCIYMDFSATEDVRSIFSSTGSPTGGAAVQAAVQAGVYSPMEFDILALFVCQLSTLVLSSRRILDKTLAWIAVNWYFITFTNCLFWAVVVVVDSSWFFMAKVDTIYLMARPLLSVQKFRRQTDGSEDHSHKQTPADASKSVVENRIRHRWATPPRRQK